DPLLGPAEPRGGEAGNLVRGHLRTAERVVTQHDLVPGAVQDRRGLVVALPPALELLLSGDADARGVVAGVAPPRPRSPLDHANAPPRRGDRGISAHLP